MICRVIKAKLINDVLLCSPHVPHDKCGDVGLGTAGRLNTTQGMGRSIAQGLLTENPESQPILLALGQASMRVDLLFYGPAAAKSVD
jgi:hypothetical protein